MLDTIGTRIAGFGLVAISGVSPISAAPVLWIGDSTGTLGTVDVATGNVSVIGDMGVTMTDIAFSPSGELYGISVSVLHSINKDTAEVNVIGSTGISSNSLVFDAAGTLYTANEFLYSLDLTSGSATEIGNGGDAYNSSGDLAFIDGALYLSSTLGSGDSLVRLDEATGVGTSIGEIGVSAVYGLATDNNIDLYGTAGDNVLSIDVTTGVGTNLVNYGGQGLGTAFGSAFIAESTDGGGNPGGGGGTTPLPASILLMAAGLAAGMRFRKNEDTRPKPVEEYPE